MLECLGNIIGLSKQDCGCFGDSRPADYNVSDSGYFIDDLEDSVALVYQDKGKNCADTIWTDLARAKAEAINDFQTELITAIAMYKESSFQPFKGKIGDDKVNKIIAIPSGLVGIRLSPRLIKGAYMKINNITLQLNDAVTTTIQVYTTANGTDPLLSLPITTEEGKATSVSANLEIPLTVDGNQNHVYIVYDPAGANPYNVKFNCNCGGRKQTWENYTDGYGFKIDAIDDLKYEDMEIFKTDVGNSIYTYGIRVEGSIQCDGLDFLCDNLDYDRSAWTRVMAKTIQLMAINKILNMIVKSPEINRFTLRPKEAIWGQIKKNTKGYQERLVWLAENVPYTLTDCFCNTPKMIKRGIFV